MAVLPLLASTMGVPGVEEALLLGPFDHRQGDAVLDAAAGILSFQLGEDADAGLGGHAAQLNQGRVPNQAQERGVRHRSP